MAARGDALLGSGQRLIITGGTGLYFAALTQGLAEIPQTPTEVRATGDDMRFDDCWRSLTRKHGADRHAKPRTGATRMGGAAGHRARPGRVAERHRPAALPWQACHPIVFDVERDWLNARIAQRFDMMIDQGALEEVAAVRPRYDPPCPPIAPSACPN